MPQAIVYLDKKHDLIVQKYSILWGVSKHEAILKIIEEHNEIKVEEEEDADR